MLRKRALLDGRVLYEARPGRVRRMIEEVLFAQDDFRYSAGMAEQQLRARLRGGLSAAERRLDAYVNLDYQAMFEMVTRRLSDLDRFGRHVLDYLEREERSAT